MAALRGRPAPPAGALPPEGDGGGGGGGEQV